MFEFINKNAGSLKKLSLAAMIVIPFGLYFAAVAGSVLVYPLLLLMAADMALAMKVG